jgi:hypothetical protein
MGNMTKLSTVRQVFRSDIAGRFVPGLRGCSADISLCNTVPLDIFPQVNRTTWKPTRGPSRALPDVVRHSCAYNDVCNNIDRGGCVIESTDIRRGFVQPSGRLKRLWVLRRRHADPCKKHLISPLERSLRGRRFVAAKKGWTFAQVHKYSLSELTAPSATFPLKVPSCLSPPRRL